ncbi:hypothetical protein [Bosea sp. LC85]|uniref:hypothetical protein n=1 Tax=Bosea sp. LC85 TaxID=1502851 RepID=UPI000A5C9054|nr:hypothetical protein [Bosea sp. LC85]
MPQRSIRIRLCLAAAFLAVVAMLLSAVHVQSGHNAYAMAQAEVQRHAELAAAIAKHGHAHDEGEPDERLPGHVHGHNTADHIHETANLVGQIQLGMPRFVRTVMRHEPEGVEPGLPSALERPPRSVVG